MQVELNHFLGEGVVVNQAAIGPWKSWELTFNGRSVVAVLAGIGMVNAAAATQHVISTWTPHAIVNSGCTGAHISELGQGDVVIGTATVSHAALQILANGAERHVGFSFDTVSGSVKTAALEADPGLLQIAREVARDIALPDWPAELSWEAPGPRRPVKIIEGPIASADVWTQDVARLDYLHQLHGTLCEDMEAAAINQIAARYELPFLSIKDIINNERHTQTNLIADAIGFDSDIPIQEAGRRSALVLADVIRRMPLPD
jgi:nucleoside phosphorylase